MLLLERGQVFDLGGKRIFTMGGERARWNVDYVVTHCAPTSIQNELLRARSTPDALTDFLEEVRQRCQFRYWFFGHYHDDGIVRERYVLLMSNREWYKKD